MKHRSSQTVAVLFLLASLLTTALPVSAAGRAPRAGRRQPARAQTQTPAPRPTPTPQPETGHEDDVVRITSNLVQIDATVTDGDGRIVNDLRPEDFEIHVGGKRQEITNFSFVSAEPATPAPRPAPVERGAGAPPPVPPARLRAGQVQRTIALVVDDLGTSFESITYVRRALRKFVDEQMQTGDLVAIMRTSAGMGALQQFTSDKRVLYAAIEKVRWYPAGRAGVSAFAPIEPDPLEQVRGQLPSQAGRTAAEQAAERRDTEGTGRESLDEFREQIFSVGTLGALNYIVRGLRELPGRKSVVLFSDGFEIFNKDRESTRVFEALQRLTDLANRASVVLYTLDARGLQTLGFTAADNVGDRDPAAMEASLRERRDKFFNTQEGMYYLAQQTGGFFVRNTNDIAGGIRRVLEDQRGFYLIGYRPDEETFDPVRGRGRFNKVEVKVKGHPGLKVRTRSGFFGFTEEETRDRPAGRTRKEQLTAAIFSPFSSNDIPLRLTSLFSSEGEKRDVIGTILHIDASGFKFEEEADGWRKATLDIVALTFGDNGQVIDEVNRTETIRARGETFETLRRDGLIFSMQLPLKKPGAYQLRVAVRDAGSERTGSASQFVEAPDLSKQRLALSGILLMGSGNTDASGAAAPANGEQTPAAGFDPMATPAVRRFKEGASIDYYMHVYNARLDPATAKPRLQYQTRIFRDGQPVYSGRVQTYDPGRQTDMKRLLVAGRLKLGTNLSAGEYVLQQVVTDTLAKEKQRLASAWIEFEIVK